MMTTLQEMQGLPVHVPFEGAQLPSWMRPLAPFLGQCELYSVHW